MLLRRATERDLPAVGEVTVAAYERFLLGPDDSYRDRLRDAGSRYREAELWVATPDEDDEVLGTVTMCPVDSPWRELARGDEAEFRMLAVGPAAQGQGVGEALVRLCLRRAAEQGADGVVLSSLPQMTAAHRIYRRLGFRRDPSRDWQPVPGTQLIAFDTRLDDR